MSNIMSKIKTVAGRRLEYFPYDTFEVFTKDVVLVCPKSRSSVGLDWHQTAAALQRIVDFLIEVTGLELRDSLTLGRSAAFHSTIVIGYRRDEDLDPCEQNPSWVDHNTIKLPWDCLEVENKTITSCTHELVHPFFKIFFQKSESLHRKEENENDWGEGFCDFLRISIIDMLNINLKEKIDGREYNWKTDSFEEYMRSTENTGDHWKTHHKPALRLLNEFRKYKQADEQDHTKTLRDFLQYLSRKGDLENEITKDYHKII